MQGVGARIKGTDTIFFIRKHQVPEDRWKDITYAKFVCELKPNKAKVNVLDSQLVATKFTIQKILVLQLRT